MRKEILKIPIKKCWSCKYCDKESVLKGGEWVLTKTGYCLAEKSAVNKNNDFYNKVYINSIYNECNQFELNKPKCQI